MTKAFFKINNRLNLDGIDNNIKIDINSIKSQKNKLWFNKKCDNENEKNDNCFRIKNINLNSGYSSCFFNKNHWDLSPFSLSAQRFPIKTQTKLVCMYDKINKSIQNKQKNINECKCNIEGCGQFYKGINSFNKNTYNSYFSPTTPSSNPSNLPQTLSKTRGIPTEFSSKRPLTATPNVRKFSGFSSRKNAEVLQKQRPQTSIYSDNKFNEDKNSSRDMSKCLINCFTVNGKVNFGGELEECKKNSEGELTNKESIFNNPTHLTPTYQFNKTVGKFYSCSNNSHVTIKRKKKLEILNNLYFDTDPYSEEESQITESIISSEFINSNSTCKNKKFNTGSNNNRKIRVQSAKPGMRKI